MKIDPLKDKPPAREVYIVRLWQREDSQADWTGQIQHVSSGEVTAIRDLENLLEFFRRQLGQPVKKPRQKSKLK